MISWEQRIADYKDVFGSEAGKRVLEDMEHYSMSKYPVFIKREGQMADPLELAFLDGRRDVYWMIVRTLETREEDIKKRMEEGQVSRGKNKKVQ